MSARNVNGGQQVNPSPSVLNQLKLILSNILKHAADYFSNKIGLDLDIVVTVAVLEHTLLASKFMLGCNSIDKLNNECGLIEKFRVY